MPATRLSRRNSSGHRPASADRTRGAGPGGREHLLLLELVAQRVDLELVLLGEASLLLLQVEGAVVVDDLALRPARRRQALDLGDRGGRGEGREARGEDEGAHRLLKSASQNPM